MPRFTKPRQKIPDADMDITPMIDCTFLLLIFFLVASRIDTAAVLKLPEARTVSAVVVQQSVILTVLKGDGDRAKVFFGDGTDEANIVDAATPADQEAAIAEYVDELSSRNSKLKYVLIKAESDVKHREVSRIAKAATSTAEAIDQLYVAVLTQQ